MSRPGLRQLVVGLVLAATAGAAVAVAVGRVAGTSNIRAALDGAEPSWLIVCAVGQVAVFAGYAGVFRRATADDGGELTAGESVRIVLSSFAATQLLAFGGAAGLALLYWVLRRRGRSRRDAAVTLIGLNTAVYLVFAVLACTAAVFASVDRSAPMAMTVPWLVGVPIVVALAAWFTGPARRSRWDRPDGRPWRRALGVGVAAATWVRDRLVGDPQLFAWALLYWLGDLVSLSAALRSFGGDPEVAPLTIAYATGYLAQAIPVPMIATAGVDVATAATLHAVGVALETSLLGVIAHRIFAFWLPVLPGIALAVGLPAAAWANTDGEAASTS